MAFNRIQCSVFAVAFITRAIVGASETCFQCTREALGIADEPFQVAYDVKCPLSAPVGYYPDLTDCNAYCYCTGTDAGSRYQRCNPSYLVNDRGTFPFLTGPAGSTQGMWGSIGQLCIDESTTSFFLSSEYSSRPGCNGNPPVFVGYDATKTPKIQVGGCLATSSPTKSPSSMPSIEVIEPTSAPTPATTPIAAKAPSSPEPNQTPAGVMGDPHFTTWPGNRVEGEGEHFEYHGECDLELLSDPNFDNGKGLRVHIRTKIVDTWSYVKNVAIRYGNDTLEVQGSLRDYKVFYWLNGEYNNILRPIGDISMHHKVLNRKAHSFTIDLRNEKQNIIIRTYRELVRVEFVNAKASLYSEVQGILGNFTTGERQARDGSKFVVGDFNAYGSEWQLRSDAPNLFHKAEGPQYPEKCILPQSPKLVGRTNLRRGKGMAEGKAKAACRYVIKNELVNCIKDVMASNDVDVAGAYHNLK